MGSNVITDLAIIYLLNTCWECQGSYIFQRGSTISLKLFFYGSSHFSESPDIKICLGNSKYGVTSAVCNRRVSYERMRDAYIRLRCGPVGQAPLHTRLPQVLLQCSIEFYAYYGNFVDSLGGFHIHDLDGFCVIKRERLGREKKPPRPTNTYRPVQIKATALLSTRLAWLAAAGQKLSLSLAPFNLINPVLSGEREESVQ